MLSMCVHPPQMALLAEPAAEAGAKVYPGHYLAPALAMSEATEYQGRCRRCRAGSTVEDGSCAAGARGCSGGDSRLVAPPALEPSLALAGQVLLALCRWSRL
jgi:hypothetical protein